MRGCRVTAAYRICYGVALAAMVAFCHPRTADALKRSEILVVVNGNCTDGVGVARYYCRKRKLSENQIFTVYMTEREACSREEYETALRKPLKDYLISAEKTRPVRCLVLMYGIPLKINQSGKDKDRDTVASVDSEITLVKLDSYELDGWIPNPLFADRAYRYPEGITRETIMMVSRLDAPSSFMVRRMIRDSLSTERRELKGTACFDARWPKDNKAEPSGYTMYDRSIHAAADSVRSSGKMPVVVNSEDSLFGPGECIGPGVYCGWYSLGKYHDVFDWEKGAVAYHIASSECTTLKRKGSQVWCKRLIEEGVAVTIGPVDEPYVQAFPVPELFFGSLLKGNDTLVEVYFYSLPHISWKMVLVGDPLYRPFDFF